MSLAKKLPQIASTGAAGSFSLTSTRVLNGRSRSGGSPACRCASAATTRYRETVIHSETVLLRMLGHGSRPRGGLPLRQSPQDGGNHYALYYSNPVNDSHGTRPRAGRPGTATGWRGTLSVLPLLQVHLHLWPSMRPPPGARRPTDADVISLEPSRHRSVCVRIRAKNAQFG
jgi:hypothetical protein